MDDVTRTLIETSDAAPPPVVPDADRYRLLGRLGRGGMGEVLRVEDARLGISVAMKVLASSLVDVAGARARFATEASITTR